LQKRKLSKIELDVWEFNESAIEFYQAVDLDPCGYGWNMMWKMNRTQKEKAPTFSFRI